MRIIFKGGSAWSAGLGVFEGLAIEDGRVIATGPEALKMAGEVIDLDGGFVLPGFIDGHAHPIFAGREARGPKVNNLQSVAAIKEEVAKYAKANPSESWIIGGAYEAAIVSGGDFDAHWLDEVVSDRPVVLHAVDHHTIWVNSKALEIAGISADTKNPDGGTIARREDGSPKGTLREPIAFDLILKHAPADSVESDLQAIKYACKELISAGVTTATECWVEPPMAEAYIAAAKSGALTIDMHLAFLVTPQNWQEQIAYIQEMRAQISKLPEPKRLKANTIKFLTDGALSSGTAAMLDPYLDNPESTGLKIWDDENLVAAISAYDLLKFQVHIHAIGDGAINQSLNAVENMVEKNPNWDRRPVIVHAQLIAPSDLARFKELGIIANFQPLWTYLDPMNKELIEPRIGAARNNRQYQLRTLLDLNTKISFGSDWPVTSHKPLEAIFIPVLRKVPGSSGEAWSATEAITLEESLTSYTANAAYQLFDELEIGKLEAGMRANFVILDKSPFESYELNIKSVWIVGQSVKVS
ncbi:COG1574 Predicted metal-dependent hydrolase with the TIM-barrel fold [actinobacterium SCGC AAA044-D11]